MTRRTTPVSVRYLGRRVYLAAIVVLASAMRAGVTTKRAAALHTLLQVPLRTLVRWRSWWLEGFVATPFWRAAGGIFLPPLATVLLPASLLSRFTGTDWATQVRQCLRFLAPLSTVTESR